MVCSRWELGNTRERPRFPQLPLPRLLLPSTLDVRTPLGGEVGTTSSFSMMKG
jgi:hypothetical protein